MAAIIPVGLGRHVTELTVTMQNVNVTTGELTDSAVVANLITSTGTLHTDLVHTAQLSDDIQFAIRNNLEAIQAITRNRLNQVATTRGASITLAEIVRRGTDVARLAACRYEAPSQYARVTYFRFGAGYEIYMRLRSFRMNPSRTKNVDVAEFVLIDAGVNPAYTAGSQS